MRTNKKIVLVFCIIALALLAAGAAGIFLITKQQNVPQPVSKDGPSLDADGVRTFADWSDEEIFSAVPAIQAEGVKINKAESFGGENYVIHVSGTSKEDYDDYLKLLEQCGYDKYVDNGETGLEEIVYSSTYTKDSIVLTVTHMDKLEKTSISVCENLPLSEHLFYNDKYVAGVTAEAKTKVHMLELYNTGNSFVIQLKNGNFIISDGGDINDFPYLLDYMESLVPAGKKPVIEAWIVTHCHNDHMGAFEGFAENPEEADRLYVEGVYYSEVDSNTAVKVGDTSYDSMNLYVKTATSKFKTQAGETTKIYRPQTGQRYYFCDLTVDILFAQEQLSAVNYYGAGNILNDSSTWCMFTIDEQKFLLCGDASRGSMRAVMLAYPSEYFQVDVFATFHHALNSEMDFTNYMSAKTVLFTFAEKHSKAANYGKEANKALIERAEDSYAWGDGTVMLTFPYVPGTATILPRNEWIYHDTREPEWLTVYPQYTEKYLK